MSKWKKGLYKPTNPEKYKGDFNNILLRSSWEFSFAKFLDNNPNVLEWASEEFHIPYYNPTLNRNAKYYPDFWVKYQDKNGITNVEVIEIKPFKQTQRPKNTNPHDRNAWIVNMSKWEAAIKFCKPQGIKFRVLTEKSIFK
jgi:hypothetical protein